MKETLLNPITLRLPKEIIDTAKQQAESLGMTTAQYFRKLISEGIKGDQTELSKQEKIEFQSILEVLLMVRTLVTKAFGKEEGDKILSNVRDLTVQKLREIIEKQS